MVKIGSLCRIALLTTKSVTTVTAKRVMPNAKLFKVGKSAYAVKLTPTMHIAVMYRIAL